MTALRSPWTRDAAAAVATFAAGVFVLVALPELRITWVPELPEPSRTASVLVVALACAGVVVRRRLPLLTLLVTLAAFTVSVVVLGRSELVTLVVLGDALYCAVLHTSRRVSRVVCVATAVPVAVLPLLSLVAEGARTAVLSLLSVLLVLAMPVLWAYEVRRHRELAEVERARAAQAAQLADANREAAVAAERARMARDLHDVVAGQLSAIALQSEAALTSADDELRERVLRGVRDASVSALAEMRTMIGLLRSAPDGDDPRTAPARLDQLDPLLTSARSGGLRVRVRDDRDTGPTAAGVELAAYRIVQEGLTNVVKHAPGASVTVTLRHCAENLEVRVRNGPPVSGPASGAGLSSGTGLDGLRVRAAAVGGTVDAGPDGDGWRLAASLPRHGAPVSA